MCKFVRYFICKTIIAKIEIIDVIIPKFISVLKELNISLNNHNAKKPCHFNETETKEVIKQINLEEKKIIVKLIKGL